MSEDVVTWVSYEPDLLSDAEDFRVFTKRLRKEGTTRLRRELSSAPTAELNGELRLRLAQLLLLDLLEQGWVLDPKGRRGVRIAAPRSEEEDVAATKERVRRGHMVERDSYLEERAVREFIVGMEQRRLTKAGWHSIYSVMRDGSDLADDLREATSIADSDERDAKLATIIQPYVQFVETNAVCEHTGLSLNDIWRYFRLTWVNAPKSVPGRSFMVLVRDAAAPNHPVIGIAALGSSVVQQELRDNWIGWNAAAFVERLQQEPTAKMAKWLLAAIEKLIEGIRTDDLVRDKIIKKREIAFPAPETLLLLREEAARAKEQHRKFPDALEHKRRQGDWKAASEMHLFRWKRADMLAKLLGIRMAFENAGLEKGTKAELAAALKAGAFRSAVGQLIRQLKAEHVGIDMLDITVCGAVAPYNHILGGKLVCMLLTSPEVVAHYNRRYADHESVIASSMQGSAVNRKPKLVLLCTTSLYGAGSSQYNRVRIPADAIGGKTGARIEYRELGLSKGFGSSQYTSTTTAVIDTILSREEEGSKVNSIFGEGTNPLMRKIRQALELLGLPADQLMNHGNPRVVYGVALAENFREVLLGLDAAPKYILPSRDPEHATDAIAAYWRVRWLRNRIANPDVLAAVERHTVSYPVTHGARVPFTPKDDEGDVSLW